MYEDMPTQQIPVVDSTAPAPVKTHLSSEAWLLVGALGALTFCVIVFLSALAGDGNLNVHLLMISLVVFFVLLIGGLAGLDGSFKRRDPKGHQAMHTALGVIGFAVIAEHAWHEHERGERREDFRAGDDLWS
jgi:hypothetical protein